MLYGADGLNEVASVTRPRPSTAEASTEHTKAPQRSCLGNKTEADGRPDDALWRRWPQRSCLGNKTEAMT